MWKLTKSVHILVLNCMTGQPVTFQDYESCLTKPLVFISSRQQTSSFYSLLLPHEANSTEKLLKSKNSITNPIDQNKTKGHDSALFKAMDLFVCHIKREVPHINEYLLGLVYKMKFDYKYFIARVRMKLQFHAFLLNYFIASNI